MKDHFEKFISDNRGAFDSEVPDLKVWAAIDKELSEEKSHPPSKIRPLRHYLSMAAAVALFLSVGAAIGIQLGQQNSSEKYVSSEFEEMKSYYSTKISEKQARLASYPQSADVQEDLLQLDEFLQELKAELEEAPEEDREQVINAMVRNYQARLGILERVLEKIESTNQENSKSEKDELPTI